MRQTACAKLLSLLFQFGTDAILRSLKQRPNDSASRYILQTIENSMCLQYPHHKNVAENGGKLPLIEINS